MCHIHLTTVKWFLSRLIFSIGHDKILFDSAFSETEFLQLLLNNFFLLNFLTQPIFRALKVVISARSVSFEYFAIKKLVDRSSTSDTCVKCASIYILSLRIFHVDLPRNNVRPLNISFVIIRLSLSASCWWAFSHLVIFRSDKRIDTCELSIIIKLGALDLRE